MVAGGAATGGPLATALFDQALPFVTVTPRDHGVLQRLFDTTAMDDELILFPAGNAHLDRIRELHFTGLNGSGSLSLDPELDRDLIDIERSYAGGLFLLAAWRKEPAHVIGMGALAPFNDGYQIKRMRVDASHRRRGVGQAILARLVSEARRRAIPMLTLDTSLRQVEAQRLYERNGFAHVGDIEVGGIASRLYRLSTGQN